MTAFLQMRISLLKVSTKWKAQEFNCDALKTHDAKEIGAEKIFLYIYSNNNN